MSTRDLLIDIVNDEIGDKIVPKLSRWEVYRGTWFKREAYIGWAKDEILKLIKRNPGKELEAIQEFDSKMSDYYFKARGTKADERPFAWAKEVSSNILEQYYLATKGDP